MMKKKTAIDDDQVNLTFEEVIEDKMQGIDWDALTEEEGTEFREAWFNVANSGSAEKSQSLALDTRLIDAGFMALAVTFALLGEMRYVIAAATMFAVLVLWSLNKYSKLIGKNELAPIRLGSLLDKLRAAHPVKKAKRAR